MSVSSHRRDPVKANGVHYTPPDLAAFLADGAVRHANFPKRPLVILDPACGDGQLLAAMAEGLPKYQRKSALFVGYERDAEAAANAERRLRDVGVGNVDIRHEDFLDAVLEHRLIGNDDGFADFVISNPPYVRTQLLGARRAQKLATQFQLTGRADLYQAFIQAMASVLRVGGVLSLLTSNRFMLTQSGAAVRRLLRNKFTLLDLYDLGDTRFFAAAVLPAIVIARNETPNPGQQCNFVRVYRENESNKSAMEPARSASILAALRNSSTGRIAVDAGYFRIERGTLETKDDPAAPWSLSTKEGARWLAAIHHRRRFVVDDIAKVRVGVKTTADNVFIREDWDSLPVRQRPEADLLRPLLTHHDAARWSAADALPVKKILYPYAAAEDGSRITLDIHDFPRARNYLLRHRRQLEARKYVLETGRPWYEIWVPQQPKDWLQPKVVYPDIAERPRFFLDRSAAVVNGDCYWITLKPGIEFEWLLLLLATANSALTTRYYDAVFHNKLYAGRRRYMTQYVRQFPLPNIDSPPARKIIDRLSSADPITDDDDQALDDLVEESFRE